MKNNEEFAKIFDDIGFFLSLKGDNPFKIRAYHNASLIIKKLPFPLFQVREKTELKKISGIGEAISDKIIEIMETGDCALHRKLLNEFSPLILEVRKINGIGIKTIKILYDNNINSIKELNAFLYNNELNKQISEDKISVLKQYLNERKDEKK